MNGCVKKIVSLTTKEFSWRGSCEVKPCWELVSSVKESQKIWTLFHGHKKFIEIFGQETDMRKDFFDGN